MIEFQCCFCKATVGAEEGPRGFDPCSVIIVASWAKPRAEQREQQFFCHFECFRQVIDDDGNLYIMEPDFPTIGGSDDDKAETTH